MHKLPLCPRRGDEKRTARVKRQRTHAGGKKTNNNNNNSSRSRMRGAAQSLRPATPPTHLFGSHGIVCGDFTLTVTVGCHHQMADRHAVSVGQEGVVGSEDGVARVRCADVAHQLGTPQTNISSERACWGQRAE